MNMRIYSAGGKKVFSEYKGFTVRTEQTVKGGGATEYPEPFDTFLASLGTCAGIYVYNFCQARQIPYDKIELEMSMEMAPQGGLLGKINIEIKLPPDFPEKYKDAVIKAADLCYVKKHLHAPPEFSIFTSTIGS